MTQHASLSAESDSGSVPLVSEGRTIGGKYLVGTLLGLGGMGVVHSARDLSLGRRVALKVLLPRLVASATASGRFLREARAASKITSEHVVKLLESDTLSDGTPLLVMEYLDGRDLRALLREDGPLPAHIAVDYILQALQGIAEGHTHGIVHRDVKPSNLFLTERADGTPLIKVLDFGIAKTLGPTQPEDCALTNSEDVQLGSPTYMPPEQFQNPRDVDARADIWSLGVTLYELISGSVPFRGQGYLDLVSKVLNETPGPLKAFVPKYSLPKGLEQVIFCCLEKNRERRYKNAAELARALAPFGSEDARLSLTRVVGIGRPRISTQASAAVDLRAQDVTLPVAIDPALNRQDRATSTGARVPPRTRADRIALVLGTLAAAAVLGGLWHYAGQARPDGAASNAVAAPLIAAASPQPLAVAPPAPDTRPSPAPRASHVLPGATSHRSAHISPPAAQNSSAAPAASAIAAGTPPREAERAALIESLIQQRH